MILSNFVSILMFFFCDNGIHVLHHIIYLHKNITFYIDILIKSNKSFNSTNKIETTLFSFHDLRVLTNIFYS